MRVLLLTSNSIQNMALSHILGKHHELVGIVYENRFAKGNRLTSYLRKVNYNIFKVFKKIYQKSRLQLIENIVSEEINKGYKSYSSFYNTDKLEVLNINQKEAVNFIKSKNYDIIVVSGTRIVKKEILSLRPTYGIINMHTGLSPYYNGGPSCTFWCVYNDDIEFIGATVMFIDEGIDSGNIVLSDTIDLGAFDNYGQLEFKAIDLGNQLILKAIDKIEKDRNFKGHQQKDISSGYVYYNRDYTFDKRMLVQKKIKEGIIKELIASKNFRNDIIRIRD